MNNIAPPPHFTPKALVLALRKALPFCFVAVLGVAVVSPAVGQSGDSSVLFTTTQLIRQFTLKNTVAQVTQGMQSSVVTVNGALRSAAMGATQAGFPTDMGTVPASSNLPQLDGAGRPLGYCAWDNTAGSSNGSFLAGLAVASGSRLVYAVVSSGLDGIMSTSCADVLTNRRGQGDDFVQFSTPNSGGSSQLIASVATENDLTTTPGVLGDIRLARDTNKLFSHDGTSWNALTANSDPSGTVTGSSGTFSGNITADSGTFNTITVGGGGAGTITATGFIGNGSGLTDLNAGNITSGILSTARGGTGLDTSAAAQGALLIGNGGGFSLGTLAAGNGIGIVNGAGSITISNTGVLSIAGTANQVIASANTGNIVLSLPQDIATTSTPTFGGLMLNGNLTGTTASFAGAVTVDSLSALRLNVGTSAGPVTNPNLIVGNGAMPGAQTGAGNNAAIGINALNQNTSGQRNTAVGNLALYTNTTGSNNTANGFAALYSNTTGTTNVAIGNVALYGNTTGNNNVAIGNGAGYSTLGGVATNANTTGGANTFLGSNAMPGTTTPLFNATALGAEATVSTTNTLALGRNSTLDQVVIGTDSRNDTFAGTKLYVNGVTNLNGDLRGTTANFTGRVDAATLFVNGLEVTGGGSVTRTAIETALEGNFNIALGDGALEHASFTGTNNTVFGVGAAALTTAASTQNVVVGRLAGQLLGRFTAADGNTLVGYQAGYQIQAATGGDYNTLIGHNSDGGSDISYGSALGAGTSVTGASYSTAIGSGSSVATSNTIALGRNSATDQIVIGTDTRNDTFAGTKLYVNGVTNLGGDLRGTTATFTGALTANSFVGNGSGLTNLDAADFTTGTLAVARGGTGLDGSAAANGSLLIGNGTGYTLGTLTGTADQINVTNGAGTITLSLPQNIATTSTPTFGGLTLNGAITGTTGTFTGAVTVDSLSALRLNLGTSAGPVTNPNLIIGNGAMPGAQSGTGENTAVGINALAANTSGRANVAVGYSALLSNTTGRSQVAIGRSALTNNTTGIRNSAVGNDSMLSNSTGSENIAFGAFSLRSNTTGNNNTVSGYSALSSNTTGSRNTAFGASAGNANTTGGDNTFLGNQANATSDALTFATAIGSQATVATSATMALGRNSALDQVVIGTDTRNDTFAGTKLYVNGVTNLNGDLRGTTATFSGALTGTAASFSSNATVGGTLAVTGATTLTGALAANGGITSTTGTFSGAVSAASFVGDGSGLTNLDAADFTTGTLAVARGGTGLSATPTNGQLLIGNGTGYTLGTLTGTADQINVTNGAGTITLSLPQSIATTSTPTFGGLTLNGAITGTTGTFTGAVTVDSLGAQRLNVGTSAGGVTNPNLIIGNSAMAGAQTGNGANTAVGISVLNANTSGGDNTGVGHRALRLNTTGLANVAVGVNALSLNTSGNNNTVAGVNAMGFNTTGTGNVASGRDALYENTTGSRNIGIGTSAGRANTTGSDNTFLGNQADATSGALTFATAIGSGSTVATSATMALGRNSTADQVVIGTASRNDTFAGTKLYVNGVTNLNGDLRGTTATFSGALTGTAASFSSNATVGGTLAVTGATTLTGALAANGGITSTTGTFSGAVTAASFVGDGSGLTNLDVADFTTGILPVARGGTGVNASSAANGQLLIGNGSGFTLATLTAGSGITISNSSGGIQITSSGGSVTRTAIQTVLEGNFNIALGTGSLQHASFTGTNNTVFGVGAANLTTGASTQNVVIGRLAGQLLGRFTAADGNTLVGYQAGYQIQAASGGDYNTLIGHNSDGGSDITYGTALGTSASVTGASYSTAIGAGASATSASMIALGRSSGADQVVLGASARDNTYASTVLYANGNLHIDGTVNMTAENIDSDRRLKTNIVDYDTDAMLNTLAGLKAYSYQYISNPEIGRRIGVIAQELLPLFPEAVATNNAGLYSVDYNALGAMAAAGVGRLNTKVKALDSRVTEQGTKILALEDITGKHDTRIGALENWKTDAINRMDTMQGAIDLNIQKIADHAVAIQTNTEAIERLDDALITLDDKVKGNARGIDLINQRWARNFSESADGSLLTVNAVELKVSNFTAQNLRTESAYTQRLEAEMARIAELEVNNLRANNATAKMVRAEEVNTGSGLVYAGVGSPAFLFAAPADGHYTVNTSSMDGSHATATVIVNAGQAKVISISSEGIQLIAEGNMVKAIAAGKSIRASWTKVG